MFNTPPPKLVKVVPRLSWLRLSWAMLITRIIFLWSAKLLAGRLLHPVPWLPSLTETHSALLA